jgi:hypothetical protein
MNYFLYMIYYMKLNTNTREPTVTTPAKSDLGTLIEIRGKALEEGRTYKVIRNQNNRRK